MKTLLLMLLTIASSAMAVPVLNQNMAAEGTNITIWPDHADPDHFFYAPSEVVMALKDGKAKFHLTRFRTGCGPLGIGCKSRAMINTLLVASFKDEELARAQEGIRRLRPAARFSSIPMLDGEVKFTNTLRPFVVQDDCSPRTGQASDEIPCSLILNKSGLQRIVPMLNDGKVLAFQFVYKLVGVNFIPDHGFQESITRFGVAVQFGGDSLVGHEDLQ